MRDAAAATVPIPHILLLLDGSSSMKDDEWEDESSPIRWQNRATAVMNSFNWFMDEQNQIVAPCDISVRVFRGGGGIGTGCDDYSLCTETPIHLAPRLRMDNYLPTGGTNLRRSMVDCFGAHQRPTIMVAMSDGHDGSPLGSMDAFTISVRRQIAAGWTLFFLGVGSDSALPSGLGVLPQSHILMLKQEGPALHEALQQKVRLLSVAVGLIRGGIPARKAIQMADLC